MHTDPCQVGVELLSVPMPVAGKHGMGRVSCAPQPRTNNQAALKANTHRDLSPAKAHSANTRLLSVGRSGVAIFIFKGLFETGRAQ